MVAEVFSIHGDGIITTSQSVVSTHLISINNPLSYPSTYLTTGIFQSNQDYNADGLEVINHK